MKVVFFGTSGFAVPVFAGLLDSGIKVNLAVTTPGAKSGRGLKLSESPVKREADSRGVRTFQPHELSEAADRLAEEKADFFAVVSYGKMLPARVLSVPRLFCVNLHPSLLPRYRGASPINRVLQEGDETTGVTVIRMTEKMDAGDIISFRELPVLPDDDAVTLSGRLAGEGAELLAETLKSVESSGASFTPQDESRATYAPAIRKEEGLINWGLPAGKIHNNVRAFVPWPCAYTHFRGKMLKIWKAQAVKGDAALAPGTVIDAGPAAGITVAAGGGAVLIKELQLQGRKRMAASDFLRGTRVERGEKLSQSPPVC